MLLRYDLTAIGLCAVIAINYSVVRTWTPSGLIAMKLFPTVSYSALQMFTPKGNGGVKHTSAR